MRSIDKPRHRGASLIEVLVAILIVSLGILALAGLLGVSSRLGKTSEFRALAALLAADIGDRMRANRPDAGVGNAIYDITSTELASDLPSEVTCTTATNCTATELANKDKAEWQAILFNGLPSGTGYVSYVSAQQAADVWIIWRDPKAVADGDNAVINDGSTNRCPPNFPTTENPTCVYFRIGL